MTKPDSIRKFDLCYLASLVIGPLAILLNWDTAVRTAVEAGAAAGGQRLGEGAAVAAIVVGMAFSLLIGLALWFLASRQRVGLVRWIIALFAAWSVVSTFIGSAAMSPLLLILNIVAAALTVAAAWYLFRPDALAWFETRRGD